MYRANYQNLEGKSWSNTAVVALVATASLAVGVTAGFAMSSNAQATLYATTTVQPVAQATAVIPVAAVREFAAEDTVEEGADQQQYVLESYQAQPQGISGWAAGMAAAASIAVGALAYKVKERVPKVAPLDIYTKGVIPAATLMAAQPAMAMETNKLAPIATALFIALPTFFLIVLYVSTRANLDNQSGAFDQDYYDRSKSAGNKKTNEAARLRGAGLGMYAEKRNSRR